MIAENFRLYVTGFPQFFSDKTVSKPMRRSPCQTFETWSGFWPSASHSADGKTNVHRLYDECDKVTFARTANPVDDDKPHEKMTQALSKEYNAMSVQLNKAIADAVSRNSDQGVTWAPIDDAVEGHRFCEPGVVEPDQQNENLWLFHYPYNEPKDDPIDAILLNAYNNVIAGIDVNSGYSTYSSFENALLDAIEIQDDPSKDGLLDYPWTVIGYRAKVFHPKVPLHEKIRDMILDAYINDLGANAIPNPPPPPPQQPPPTPDQNACHGVGGDYWVMSRDVAFDNANAFCGQPDKKVIYNQDSVNELSLSVQNLNDDIKGPSDSPDCAARIQNAVIDGCDSNDPDNNPHNYKFGSTLTTGDGWQYTMIPLRQQVNEVSCDVSYKFWYDGFELRGKDLPDAKFGANEEGLHDQISGCGGLTDWDFERTPDDVKFQWYASGHLAIGTKGCVGCALISAGGADDGNCHGAGKRSADVTRRRPYGIEEWPGYGDEGHHVFKHPVVDKRDGIEEWPGYGAVVSMFSSIIPTEFLADRLLLFMV